MKIVAVAASLGFLVSMLGPVQADEAKQDFKLVNKTGYEIKEVYVSPSKSSDWQEDVLADGVLGDKEFREVHFNRDVKTCHWDLKVVYSEDSSSAVWGDINLCSVEKIVIHYDKDADKTSADFM